MVRDIELIRRILLEVESRPAGSRPASIEFPGEYDQTVVLEHARLMIGAGLLDGSVLKALGGVVDVMITGLTWSGHDFLDAARNDTSWNKAKALIKEKGGSFTIDLLKSLLAKLAEQSLGL